MKRSLLKKHVYASLTAAILFLSGSAVASENSAAQVLPEANLNKQITYQRNIDLALAPIRSQSDLAQYLQREPADSPLKKLSPGARQRFLSSLVFGEKGLGSYSYEDLAREVTASDIYQILGLFGVQTTTPLISHARIMSEADQAIMNEGVHPNLEPGCSIITDNCGGGGGGGEDHTGYRCENPQSHTCIETMSSICTHNC